MNRLGKVLGPPRARLTVETLEDRVFPSITTTWIDATTLRIRGTDEPEKVTVFDLGSQPTGTIQVAVPGAATKVYHRTGKVTIFFEMRGGRDIVTYQANGARFNASSPRGIVVNLEDGNDHLNLNVAAIAFDAGSLFSVLALGGPGPDVMRAYTEATALQGTARVGLYFLGGGDGDKIFIRSFLPPTLGTSLQARAYLQVIALGQAGSDTIEFTWAGTLDGDLFVRLTGDASEDTITANLLPAGDSSGSLSVDVSGGQGFDTLTLIVPSIFNLNTQAWLDAGTDSDKCSVSSNVQVQNCP
jgi:hypothetical protein